MTRTILMRMFILMLTAYFASAQDKDIDIDVAVPIGPRTEPPGFNIALAALGGRIATKPSESNNTEWAANNLIGGDFASWKSKNTNAPQHVALSFNKTRTATISGVVIDTRISETTPAALANLPQLVELRGSRENKPESFVVITNSFLRRKPGRELISFPPTALKYLQVNFLTNYGGQAFQAAKIEVYEAAPEKSIVADLPINLASPLAGGAVVRFSSPQTNITHLFDGHLSNDGWRTLDTNLPTEVVVAFRGDREALIDRIALNPPSKQPKETWPRRVSISVSAEHPLDGFEELGIFAIEPEPREQEFPVHRRARFLKLRILENQGGDNTSLGEFKVIEGRADDYRSLLMTPIRSLTSSSKVETTNHSLASVSVGTPEREPNDRAAQAVDLVSGKTIRGSIDPRTDEDFYSFNVPGPGAEVMTLELDGHPNVRTSVSLLNEAGSELKRFDPARPPTQRARLSWRVDPGRYFLRIYEPPSSIVVVWDSSSSMSGRETKLQAALETYISRVRPSERLQLVQFSRKTAALLPDFTSDPAKLRTAIKSKFKLSGGTSFFDAMTNAMTLLDKVEGNRAIIVMTDGSDSSSRLGYPEFWKQIEEKRIRIYSIGLGGNLNQASSRTGASPRRTLKHLSMATDGWEFFTEDPEELGVLYDIVADDLRSQARYAFTPRFGLGRGALQVSAGSIDRIPPKTSVVELIFDASGSMREKIEGRRKIEIAKEVMSQTIDGLPPERQVALRLFGHRMASQKVEARFDSELVVPAQLLDRKLLKERIDKLQPVGTTPIAYSLSQVTNDIGSFSGDRAVVLVTDGREEAGGDPEGVLEQLRKQGFAVRLIIVGFGLKPDVREDVRRLAENYGGHFFDANTTTELRQAIQHAVLEIPMALPFKVVDSDGIMLSEGTTGKGELNVPAGVYSVLMDAPGKKISVPNVRISPDARSKVFVRKEGSEYSVQVQEP